MISFSYKENVIESTIKRVLVFMDPRCMFPVTNKISMAINFHLFPCSQHLDWNDSHEDAMSCEQLQSLTMLRRFALYSNE